MSENACGVARVARQPFAVVGSSFCSPVVQVAAVVAAVQAENKTAGAGRFNVAVPPKVVTAQILEKGARRPCAAP